VVVAVVVLAADLVGEIVLEEAVLVEVGNVRSQLSVVRGPWSVTQGNYRRLTTDY